MIIPLTISPDFLDNLQEWITDRARLNAKEERGVADSDDWHDSDDQASVLLRQVAGQLGIIP